MHEEGKQDAPRHIRFCDEGDNDAVASTASPLSNDASRSVFSSACASVSSDSRKRKRKRKLPNKGKDGVVDSEKILNGMIVAISTLESKHTKDTAHDACEDQYQNYKTLKDVLQKLGASISPQVHKRVHYLISTDTAVQNCTQRVRQALKRKVDIVDVSWVKQCSEQKMRVAVDNYLCNDSARMKSSIITKEKQKKSQIGASGDNNLDGYVCSDLPGAGWTTPINLDCCCVCHENGDDNCPWCTDCSITRARKRRR